MLPSQDPVNVAFSTLLRWRLALCALGLLSLALPWSTPGQSAERAVPLWLCYIGMLVNMDRVPIPLAVMLPVGCVSLFASWVIGFFVMRQRPHPSSSATYQLYIGLLPLDALACFSWGTAHHWSTWMRLAHGATVATGNWVGLVVLSSLFVLAVMVSPLVLMRSIWRRQEIDRAIPPEEHEDAPEIEPVSDVELHYRSLDPVASKLCRTFANAFWMLLWPLLSLFVPWMDPEHHAEVSGLSFWFGAGRHFAAGYVWTLIGGVVSLALVDFVSIGLLGRKDRPSMSASDGWRFWGLTMLLRLIPLFLWSLSLRAALSNSDPFLVHQVIWDGSVGLILNLCGLLPYVVCVFLVAPLSIVRGLRSRAGQSVSRRPAC